MMEYIYDLVILAVLLLFALWGMHRGLILSLFSLIAALIALIGALWVSSAWSPAVAGWLQPTLQPPVTSAVNAALPEGSSEIALPVDELLLLLDDAELPMELDKLLLSLQEDGISELTSETLAISLSEKLANAIASIALFLLSFLLILLIWHLIARALDLVARLPGLNTLNKLGGFVFGAFRGALLLFICAGLIRWLRNDLIPAEAIQQNCLLNFFMTVNPLELLENLK